MNQAEHRNKVRELFRQHEKLIARRNVKARSGNGVTTGMKILCLRQSTLLCSGAMISITRATRI